MRAYEARYKMGQFSRSLTQVASPCGQMMLYWGGVATAWIKRQTINENSLNKLPYSSECVVRAPLFILAFGIRHFLCSLMWNCIFFSKEMRRSKYSLRRKCIILTALIHTSTQRYYFHVLCALSQRDDRRTLPKVQMNDM